MTPRAALTFVLVAFASACGGAPMRPDSRSTLTDYDVERACQEAKGVLTDED